MQKAKILTAGLYSRVSTERQVQEGFSLEAQQENLINFAKEQGWNIYNSYIDKGISGKNIQDRPKIKELIKDIKNKKIDVVVLYKFDRLTRDSRDTEDFIELIQNYGIMIYALSGGVVDVSTPSGRFNTRILGAAAQFERETIIDRVVDGLIKKVKDGYSLCSCTPSYGYDRPKNQEIQTINKKEAKIVKRVFMLYNEGKTLKEIADILNIEKIPTKKQGKIIKKRNSTETYTINSLWQAKTIKTILTNETYIGKVRYGINKEQVTLEEAMNYHNRKKGFIADGLHKAIIQKKLWDEVQQKLQKEKKVFKTNHPKDDVYYCKTLVCGICNHPLTTKRTIKNTPIKKVHNSYRCINKELKKCPASGMSHTKVEEAFCNYLNNIEKFEKIKLVKNKDKHSNKEELIKLKKILNRKNIKQQEILSLFTNDQLTYQEYQTIKQILKEECDKLKKEIKNLETNQVLKIELEKYLSVELKEHWKYLTNKEKLAFLTEFVEKIVIINDKKLSLPTILEVKFYKMDST